MSFVKEMLKHWGNRMEESAKEAPKNIAEPVISFIECFKKNPKRFKLSYLKKDDVQYYCNGYKLKDKFINKEFAVFLSNFSDKKFFSGAGFELTEDEKEYIFGSIESYYAERRDRYLEIKGQRNRKKLYEIYKQ